MCSTLKHFPRLQNIYWILLKWISLTCALHRCTDVCQMCQASVPALWVQLPPVSDDQVVNHWSEQINSQHVHLPSTLSGSPSVCPKPLQEPISTHQVAAIWVPPLNTQHGSLCRRVLHVCMCLQDRDWQLNVTFVGVDPQLLCCKCWIESTHVKPQRCTAGPCRKVKISVKCV